MSRSKGKARTYEYRMRNGTSGGRVEKPSVMSSEGNMRAGGSHTNSGSNLDGTSISITQAPGIKDVSQVDNITADPRSRKNKFNSDLETAKKDRSTVCEDRVLISWLRGDVLIQAQAAKVSKGCNVKSKQEIAVSNDLMLEMALFRKIAGPQFAVFEFYKWVDDRFQHAFTQEVDALALLGD